MTLTRRLALVSLLAGCVLTTLTQPLPAQAAPEPGLEERTAAVVAKHPGGTVLRPGVITWDGGRTTLTLEGAASAASIASCATGHYCAWSATSYTGTKLDFTACSATGTRSSLSALGGRVRSTANARTSGRVDAVNGSTVVYSMPADSGRASNTATLTALTCRT